MMQDFSVEIHSVESQQVVQVIHLPAVSGHATITRVPAGSVSCLEILAQKILMVPFEPSQEASPGRRDEEVQIARRLAMVSTRVYIASETTLSCLAPLPWILQADALLDINRVEEALALADQASKSMDNAHFDAERLVYLTGGWTNLDSFMKWPTSIKRQVSSCFAKPTSKML
jgi:hypothetical protein